MVDNCVEVVKISEILNMFTVGHAQASWTVIPLKISVFQEIFRDIDMEAKKEKHNFKDNEANADSSKNNKTDVTYEEELSGEGNEKDGNYSSEDEDLDVRI